MNAIFVCFTGTGNTKRVCEALADALRAQGHDVRLELLRADRPSPDVSDADRLIVAFPVHGFNAPSPVLKFLKTLPAVGLGARAAAIVCRVEHPAARLIGRGFSATDACVGCGLCARNCPQGNIRMEGGKPVFGKQCVICMACAFSCPKDAVRTGVLNGWRVNGGYRFDAPPASDEEVCSYCRKSYLRYYHRSEETVEDTD